MKARDLWTKVTPRNLGPLYHLIGDDEAIRNRCLERLQKVVAEATDDQYQEAVYRGVKQIPDAIQACETPSFFSRRTLVVLRDIEEGKKEQVQSLERYLQNPSPTATLVTSLDKIRKGTVLERILSAHGATVDCAKLTEKERVAWARKQLQSENVRIDGPALELLIARSGDSLRDLSQNVEKLVLRAEGGEVLPDQVQDLVDDVRQDTVFALTDHIVEGRTREAVLQWRKMLRRGESPTGLLYMLNRHLRILLQIRTAPSMPDKELASSVGVAPFFLRSYRAQAGRLSEASLRHGLDRLRKIDFLGKQGMLEDGPALEMQLGLLFEEPAPVNYRAL